VVARPRALERVRPDHNLASPRDHGQRHLEELLALVAVERDRGVVVPLAVATRGRGLEASDGAIPGLELSWPMIASPIACRGRPGYK
jgi:hypothetical protein